VGKGRLFVEIKSVNHRFAEINIKMPGRMSVLESYIRSHLQGKFSRGKIDVFVKEREPLFGAMSITLDTELARRYERAIAKLRRELGIKRDIDFLNVVGLDRILRVDEEDGPYEKLWGQARSIIDKAAVNMQRMRQREGSFIHRDQVKRVAGLMRLIDRISELSSRGMERNIRKMKERIPADQPTPGIEPVRAQIEAQMIGRQDIAEELLRLKSHVVQYGHLMNRNEAVGRKLDFLLQEMNREANTIGSKASDAKVSQLVVECKAELERLREQVQNVE
jgi:uncharacterized protein (TIGR00255 family)